MRVTSSLCKTTLMSESAWAERRRNHVTQTGHDEQQCKSGWKKSLHLLILEGIITYPIQSANLMALKRTLALTRGSPGLIKYSSFRPRSITPAESDAS